MHKADASATCGKVTVSVTGKTQHSVHEVRDCAFLTAEILNSICMEGEFKLIACSINFQGSQKLRGLSVKGTQNNAIILAYQPSGNQTRMKYLLHMGFDELHERFESLKAVVGTAYLGKESVRATLEPEPSANQTEEVLPQSTVTVAVTGPVEKPKVYYTSDSEWMETFVLYLLELADTKLDKCVSKDDLFDLIVEHTHYKNRFGVGPIFNTLKSRGHIVAIEGQVDLYRAVGTPVVALKTPKVASKKTSATPPVPAKVVKAEPNPANVTPAKESRQQKYLSDEEWMRSFVTGLHGLVKDSNGIISRSDLYRFIKERTNQKKVAGTVYTIMEGLTVRGLILSAGEALYRVSYTPPENIVEKAVAGIERARAETDRVFDGFAKFRMPDFAEGMFRNTQILRDFLSLVGVQGTVSAPLKEKLAEWYPVSSWSHIQLLNYMVGQGYFVRSGKGVGTIYRLGPKGYERLGLPLPKSAAPAKQVVPPASLRADMVKRSDVQAPEPAASKATPVLAGFLASVPAPAPNQVLLGLAKLATDGQAVATLIAEARERIAAKQDRKTAALTAIAQKPNIDDLVTQRLLAEIDQL